jgi:hypothetical protein
VTDFAPGPIVLGDLPLGPRIAHDGLFAALLGPVVDVLRASDSTLATAQTAIAGNTAAGLDATFNLTVGAAAAETAAQPNQNGDSTAVVLTGTGDGARAYRDGVQQFLPQPSTPIGQGFREFPTPDFGGPNQDPGAIEPPGGI